MTPSIGRIVHFVMPDGQHRPAIVVRIWPRDLVNLHLFPDDFNDKPIWTWQTSVAHDENGALQEDADYSRTWHWPEVVR